MIFIGEANIAENEPPAGQEHEYVEKCLEGFTRLGMSAKEFAQIYSVPIRVEPSTIRGH